MRRIRAAICPGIDEPLRIERVLLEGPRSGEVAVRLEASGVCGTDQSVAHGVLPAPLPSVLGHEGAGVVTEIGDGVTTARRGDHVVVAAMPQCGSCTQCRRGRPYLCTHGDRVLLTGALQDGTTRVRTAAGEPVHQLVATGTFMDEIVVSELSVVPVPEEIPADAACLLGCAVLTGAGAARNTASITPGDTVAVIGCGIVGLSAIHGARLAGAGLVVGVDVRPTALSLAIEFGASIAIDARTCDVRSAVREHTDGRGADVTIEAAGLQATVDQTIGLTAAGGEVVLVGAGDKDTRVSVRQFSGLIAASRTIRGCLFGSSDIRRDVPDLAEQYLAGKLPLDRLVSDVVPLDDIQAAMLPRAGDHISTIVDLTS